MKKNSLTQDELRWKINKMEEVKRFWLDFMFSCKNSTDKEQATESIE